MVWGRGERDRFVEGVTSAWIPWVSLATAYRSPGGLHSIRSELEAGDRVNWWGSMQIHVL